MGLINEIFFSSKGLFEWKWDSSTILCPPSPLICPRPCKPYVRAWYDDLRQVLAQECQQKPHLCLLWLQGGPHHFLTFTKFPLSSIWKPSATYEHLKIL